MGKITFLLACSIVLWTFAKKDDKQCVATYGAIITITLCYIAALIGEMTNAL